MLSMPTLNPFLHHFYHLIKIVGDTHSSPVRVNELICNLGAYAACIDHLAKTSGEAGDCGYLLRVFCEKNKKHSKMKIRIKKLTNDMNMQHEFLTLNSF